jgi:glutamine synthetase
MIYAYCEKMELNVDTLIHEIGAGQMEINFFHAHPLGLADEVFLFKRTVREAALRHDMYATFMAKPIAGEPGSAMHVHQSLVDKLTGQNIFSNPDGTPAEAVHWYIGGLQRYIPAAMALFAPYVNSYRRLSRNTAAPINIQWGYDNRTVGIRSPCPPAGAARREPRDRRRRQPVLCAGRDAGLRLPGHQEPDRAHRRRCKGDAYLGDYRCRAAWATALEPAVGKRDADLAEVLGERVHHGLHRSSRSSSTTSS